MFILFIFILTSSLNAAPIPIKTPIKETNVSFSAIDDIGVRIFLQKPAERIISLAPDITEILFAIGQGGHIVGVVSSSNYPKAARKIPCVGSYAGIDVERIFSLKPDLIITWDITFFRQLNLFKQLGVPVYTTRPSQLEDITKIILHLGQLTGAGDKAEKVAKQFTAHLLDLAEHYQHQPSIRLFYQIGPYSLITINHTSWINQIIELCGGHNIFANLDSSAPRVGMEAVFSANPEVIANGAMDDNWKERWRQWTSITAVKKDLLFTIPPELIERAGPRVLKGADLLCAYLALARVKLKSNNEVKTN